jgi:hypothetical protein
LQAAQKDLRAKAREKSASGGVNRLAGQILPKMDRPAPICLMVKNFYFRSLPLTRKHF